MVPKELKFPMATQAEKYHLAMAGEYFVAAQLHRLCVAASVTYGNAKKADVIAFSETAERAVVIEVKSTHQSQWVVGKTVPPPSQKPWVFVHLPQDPTDYPRFFVLTQSEVHKIVDADAAAYRRRFKENHGVEYGARPGVEDLKLTSVTQYENNWDAILKQL